MDQILKGFYEFEDCCMCERAIHQREGEGTENETTTNGMRKGGKRECMCVELEFVEEKGERERERVPRGRGSQEGERNGFDFIVQRIDKLQHSQLKILKMRHEDLFPNMVVFILRRFIGRMSVTIHPRKNISEIQKDADSEGIMPSSDHRGLRIRRGGGGGCGSG